MDTRYCYVMSKASNIANTTASNLLQMFAGQTVHHDAVCEQIEMTYAAARKRTAYGSYVAIDTQLRIAGVGSQWTGANYTGEHLYVFPAN